VKLPDFLRAHQIPFIKSGHEHCRSGWIQLDCPFCSPRSQHWRLGYSLSAGYLHCWLCGHIRLWDCLVELVPDRKAVAALLQHGKPELDRSLNALKPRNTRLGLPKGVGPLLPAHKRYLRQRGLCPTTVATLWGVQGIGLSSTHPWSLFIPMFQNGKMVNWTTRSIAKSPAIRYLSASESEELVPRKELLYGEDLCPSSSVLVVEGPIDAWKIGPGAVATLGTGYSRQQLLRLSKFHFRVICFDSQSDAQRRARKLVSELACFPGETFNITLSSKDPGEADEQELRELKLFAFGGR